MLLVVLIILDTPLGAYARSQNKKVQTFLRRKNAALLRKNVALSEELKKIANENLELSKKSDRSVKEMKKFNKRAFGFLKPNFP